MWGDGPTPAPMMFVGFAPGRDDDEVGVPFVGGHGRLFNELIKSAGIDPENVYLTNCLKCAPHDVTTTKAMWQKCAEHLKKELAVVKPEVIISVGAVAFRWLTGVSGVRKFRKHGIPCLLDPTILVIPIEQPLALTHIKDWDEQARTKAQMVADLKWIRGEVIRGDIHRIDDIPRDYKIAETIEEVRAFLAEFPPGSEVACDLETGTPEYEGSLFPYPEHKLVTIGFGHSPGHARVIPYEARGVTTLNYWSDEEFKEVRSLLHEFWKTHKFYGHNFVQFDCKWIHAKWDLDDIDIVFESQYASHLLDEERGGHSLEFLATKFTTMPRWKSKFTLKDIGQCGAYLCMDIDATVRVRRAIEPKLNDIQTWMLHNVQIPLGKEFRKAEQRGVRVSPDNIEKLGTHLEEVIKTAKTEIEKNQAVQDWQFEKEKTFNPNAHKQVAEVMEHYLSLPKIKETKKGGYSTDASVLEHFDTKVPFVTSLLKLRRASKLHSTYYNGIKERFEEHGEFIHHNYMIHGTVTGRPACRNPNLSNIPRGDTAERAGISPELVKNMFVASPGNCLLQADYSQAELRVLAMYSQDVELVDIFNRGVDIHTATAAKVFDLPMEKITKAQRTAAKQTAFGIIYGMSEAGLIEKFVSAAQENAKKSGKSFTTKDHVKAEKDALAFLAGHKKTHPGVWRYMEVQEKQVRYHRYQETFLGRRRHYYKIDNAALRQAYNFPIQCLHEDTKVLTNRGYVEIKSMRVNDKVWDGCEWAPALLHGPREKEEYHLIFSNGQEVRCSAEHQFELLSGQWKEAKNLKKTDKLNIAWQYAKAGEFVTPLNAQELSAFSKRKAPGPPMKKISRIDDYLELFWVFGLFVGDGFYGTPRNSMVVVNFKEKAVYNRLTQFFKRNEIDFSETIIEYKGRPSYHQIRLGTAFARLMDHFEIPLESFEKKDISPRLFTLAPEYRAAFIQGLFDADAGIIGSAGKSFILNLNIVAPELSKNSALLLQSLGIYAQVKRYKTSHRDVYRLSIPVSQLQRFKELIDFTEPKKSALLDVIIKYHDLQCEGEKKTAVPPVTLMTRRKTRKKIPMWDLEVQSQRHAFVVGGGMVVHNSLASDLTLVAIIRCCKALKELDLPAEFILTVYDSLVFDTPLSAFWDVARVVKTVMENLNFEFMNVPMKVDLEAGFGWGELKNVDLENRSIGK